LAFGIRNNTILFDQVNAMENDDPLLFENNQTGTNIDASFGLTYQFKALEVQFVALQLLNNETVFSSTYDQKELEYNFVRHFAGSIGYKFNINKSFNITPILQTRSVQGFNIQPEGILKVDYKDFLWTAVQYNYKRSMALVVGVAVSEMFVIGYSAEFSTNKFANYSGGTHEILFGIKFGKPFLSNINEKEIEEMKKSTRGYDERLEYLKRENERLRLEMKRQEDALEELKEGSSYEEIKKVLDENNLPKDSVKSAKSEVERVEEIKQVDDGTDLQKALMKSVNEKGDIVAFYKGRSVLLYPSYQPLNEIAEILKNNPTAKIEISGYTDEVGQEDGITTLSKDRADAVKAYLIKEGVDAAVITTNGMGESKSKRNNTMSERKVNRIVEITIVF